MLLISSNILNQASSPLAHIWQIRFDKWQTTCTYEYFSLVGVYLKIRVLGDYFLPVSLNSLTVCYSRASSPPSAQQRHTIWSYWSLNLLVSNSSFQCAASSLFFLSYNLSPPFLLFRPGLHPVFPTVQYTPNTLESIFFFALSSLGNAAFPSQSFRFSYYLRIGL